MLTDWDKGKEQNSNIYYANEVAYHNTLDDRFRLEVQRMGPYNGVLKVFDHEKSNLEIYSEEVGISYDALFGPDVQDVADWDNTVIDFVDNKYEK